MLFKMISTIVSSLFGYIHCIILGIWDLFIGIPREIVVLLCMSYSDYNTVHNSFMNVSSYGLKLILLTVSQKLSCVIEMIPTHVLFAIEFILAALENIFKFLINNTTYNNIKTIKKNHDGGSLIYSLVCYRYYTCKPQIYDCPQTRKTHVLTCSITPSDAPIGICYL